MQEERLNSTDELEENAVFLIVFACVTFIRRLSLISPLDPGFVGH